MERPENIIETGEYIEPNTLENDREAVLFFSYIEMIKYIDELELYIKESGELNKC